MDYNARFYDSYLNRWTQPDTIIPNGYDPQTLNRYAYAMDNPIRYNDPSGHLANCNGDDPGPQCYRPSDTGYKPAPLLAAQNETYQKNCASGVARNCRGGTGEAIAFAVNSILFPGFSFVQDVAMTVLGVPKSPYEILAGVSTMPASQIKWTQDTVSPATTNQNNSGKFIDQMADDMMDHGWNGGPLRVVSYNGEYWSLDNRRLAAAKIAGLENVPVTIYDSPSDPAISEVWNDHFTTESSGYDGEKIRVVDDRNGPEIGIGIQGNGEVEIYEPGEYSPFWPYVP